MDDRKAAILRAVIEQYIATAQPVGSGHVAKAAAVDVSSATIRNEMVALEQEGYLDQPHTSAGRIPTDKGYRFYVDDLAPPAPTGETRQQVQTFFRKAHGELERMLSDTSRLLSGITSYAGVVVGPQSEAATVRSCQLVKLSTKTVLAVLVLSNGTVEKHTIELADEPTDDQIATASAVLAELLDGCSRAAIPEAPTAPDPQVGGMVAAALSSMGGPDEIDADHVWVGGTPQLAASFEAVDTVRNVLQILEQQLVVVNLIQDVLARNDGVSIGTEMGIEPLAECSVVVAPYEVDGEPAGAVGVLGPTRMNYTEAMAAVAAVSKRLGKRLTEG